MSISKKIVYRSAQQRRGDKRAGLLPSEFGFDTALEFCFIVSELGFLWCNARWGRVVVIKYIKSFLTRSMLAQLL